jgi:cytochrome o ubiquinol oxidase operon protein cyoD
MDIHFQCGVFDRRYTMSQKESYNKSVIRYCVGAVISSLITGFVYIVVMNEWVNGALLMVAVIMGLAALQLVVQLYFFLHITEGEKPRWKLHAFWFSAMMITIVVAGSIWVMKNLDYNMGMSPEQMHKHMLEENKKGF